MAFARDLGVEVDERKPTDALGTPAVFSSAKVTPTKAGLFTALWQRDENGVTRPYSLSDEVENFILAAKDLPDHGILASGGKPGKRGFRLYTPWDTGLNRSASATWAWQRAFVTIVNG